MLPTIMKRLSISYENAKDKPTKFPVNLYTAKIETDK